jgi:hypothetical protein
MASDTEGARYQGTIRALLQRLQAFETQGQADEAIAVDLLISLRRIADALEHLAAIADATSRVRKREE